MKEAVIVSGGNIQKDFALCFLEKIIRRTGREQVCLIAADRGLDFLEEVNILPDVAVGDFDSISSHGQRFLDLLKNEACEICRLKPEKDDSDTQSAMMLAIERGMKKIWILGATGTRLDHVLANLGLLSLGEAYGASVVIVDACNYITMLQSGTILGRDSQFGKYVSFFPVGGDVCGLTLEGFQYPLNGHHLSVEDSGLTLSNEILENEARVTFEKGRLLMIMSRD